MARSQEWREFASFSHLDMFSLHFVDDALLAQNGERVAERHHDVRVVDGVSVLVVRAERDQVVANQIGQSVRHFCVCSGRQVHVQNLVYSIEAASPGTCQSITIKAFTFPVKRRMRDKIADFQNTTK